MPSDSPTTLLQAAAHAADRAYAPYSHFHVGAALETDDGRIFTGCNVENASYGLTICAERNALFAMVASGCRTMIRMAIFASGPHPPYPCGACRQVIREFARDDALIFVANTTDPNQCERFRLGELLPMSFSLRLDQQT